MQCVTAVDGLWLAELGPVFFSVKSSATSRMVSESCSFITFVYYQVCICIILYAVCQEVYIQNIGPEFCA